MHLISVVRNYCKSAFFIWNKAPKQGGVKDFPVCQMGVSQENQLITHDCGSLQGLYGLIMEKLHAAVITGRETIWGILAIRLRSVSTVGDSFAYCRPKQGTTIRNLTTN